MGGACIIVVLSIRCPPSPCPILPRSLPLYYSHYYYYYYYYYYYCYCYYYYYYYYYYPLQLLLPPVVSFVLVVVASGPERVRAYTSYVHFSTWPLPKPWRMTESDLRGLWGMAGGQVIVMIVHQARKEIAALG